MALAASHSVSRFAWPGLASQVAAREAMERSYEGFSPAVTAIMADRARFPGVLGPLADFVRATTASPRPS